MVDLVVGLMASGRLCGRVMHSGQISDYWSGFGFGLVASGRLNGRVNA